MKGMMILILPAIMLTGCRTKTVTETFAVHDTLCLRHADTVRMVSHERSADTLRIETERVVTLSPHGDTIRVAVYRDRWRDRVLTKTDTVRELTTDTIYKVSEQWREKTTVKEQSWWQRWAGAAAVVAVIAVLIALCRRLR